jgi:geranylgeranylglycerol-phosphate geranylgeranyltransferase
MPGDPQKLIARRNLTIFGNWMVSWMSASAFLFGGLLSGGVSALIIIIFTMSFAVSMGRELIKAIEDVPGDKKAGAKTLPIMAGPQFAGWLAAFFIFFAVLFSFLPYAFGMLNAYYLYMIILADAAAMYSCFLIFPKTRRAQQMVKLGMLLSIIAFIIGAL